MKAFVLTALSATLLIGLGACGSQAEPSAPSETTPGGSNPDAIKAITAAEEPQARASEPSQASFPVNYRGNWDYSEDGCDKAESGTRFVIMAHEIKGYEDTSRLVSVQTIPNEGEDIRVVLENQSADGNKTLVQTLRLSPVEGISLRIEQDGKAHRAYRCDPV